MSDAIYVSVLIALTSTFITWVIVNSKIASRYVTEWQFHWEHRWIKKRTEPGSTEEFDAVESDEWNSKMAYLPTCHWCTGFWVSGATVLATYLTVGAPYPLLLWPAVTTVVGLLLDETHHKE